MKRDNLGSRMKEFYEQVPKTRLLRRTPVAIRIDGKAFHTFTRNFRKPFDGLLVMTMQDTMKYLCENIQGCVFGYTQSDEITLILCDYQTLTSSAWFDYEVQKMCSVAASMATLAFMKSFEKYFNIKQKDYFEKDLSDEEKQYFFHLCDALEKGAMFDARCFNIPREEVTNLLYWRQLDAIRNSIQMAGQANFKYKELHGKSCSDILQMLLTERNIDWEKDYHVCFQRGSCCIKVENESDREKWMIDRHIPIFKDDGRAYVETKISF